MIKFEEENSVKHIQSKKSLNDGKEDKWWGGVWWDEDEKQNVWRWFQSFKTKKKMKFHNQRVGMLSSDS